MESKVNGGKKGAKRSGSKSTQAEDGSQDLFKEDKQDPSLYDLLQVFKDATTTDIVAPPTLIQTLTSIEKILQDASTEVTPRQEHRRSWCHKGIPTAQWGLSDPY